MSHSQFPPAWLWLVDEAIPQWVKKNYSPQESWKEKPFSADDARFFSKGILELSEIFTEERSKGLATYFQHSKFRSSYLLYFLPLQAAKFLTLFDMHPSAVKAALKDAENTGVLRVVDLGSGPGTASLSLLLLLLSQSVEKGKTLPKIEFHWFDTQEAIMKDGKALVDQMAQSFSKLRDRVEVHLHCVPWWKALNFIPGPTSLVFVGHLLNESTAPRNRETENFWGDLLEQSSGGGLLFVEPAARKASQNLSLLRNHGFDSEWIERTPTRIWGPCLHAEMCPLTDGRDWCHFSVPAVIPGKWFKSFSTGLGSERHWVKFSYLWFTAARYPAPKPKPELRRVISDSLSQGQHSTFLICEPEIPGRWQASPKDKIHRGDLIQTLPMSVSKRTPSKIK